jgi:hypothetical protein
MESGVGREPITTGRWSRAIAIAVDRLQRNTSSESNRYEVLDRSNEIADISAAYMATSYPAPRLDGLWILLVDNAEPVMARAGDDQTYLLVFKDVVKARQFVAASELHAEPRMVVRGNKDDILRVARSAGVVGTLLDYDPSTQQYASATSLS